MRRGTGLDQAEDALDGDFRPSGLGQNAHEHAGMRRFDIHGGVVGGDFSHRFARLDKIALMPSQRINRPPRVAGSTEGIRIGVAIGNAP